MIETLTSHTTQEALTDRIGSRGMIRRCENLNVTGLRNPREGHPKLAIMIPDEILRPHPKGSGFPQLLCRPRVGGRTCHANVDHSPRVEFNNEEGEQQTEEEIGDRQEVARPNLLGVRVQEGL